MLVDTNIFVDLLRGRPAAVAFRNSLSRPPATSVICAAELIGGARSQQEELRIRSLLLGVIVLPATFEIACSAGSFVRHFGASHNVGLGDALIAATAEHHELRLATLNVKHFPMFRGLKPAY